MDKFEVAREVIRKLQRAGYPVRKALSIEARKALGVDSSGYSADLMQALWNYANGDMGMVEARNDFKQAMLTAFTDTFDAGYQDAGAELPTSDDAGAWLNSRIDSELSNIEDLFRTLKDSLKDPNFDVGSWISDRSSGYTGSLNDVYSMGKVFGVGEEMLTFDGDDGQESCATCQEYKGQTHPASWWIDNELIPTQGNTTFECGGWNCAHGLVDKDGNWVTLNPSVYKSMKSGDPVHAPVLSCIEEELTPWPPQLAEIPEKANVEALKSHDPRMGLYKTGKDINTGAILQAFLVDGFWIRNNVWQDFTAGGNHQRYPWIPDNEMWLDVENRQEYDFTLIHETDEEIEMHEGGDEYVDAHSHHANEVEWRARHDDPAGIKEKLLRELGWG